MKSELRTTLNKAHRDTSTALTVTEVDNTRVEGQRWGEWLDVDVVGTPSGFRRGITDLGAVTVG